MQSEYAMRYAGYGRSHDLWIVRSSRQIAVENHVIDRNAHALRRALHDTPAICKAHALRTVVSRWLGFCTLCDSMPQQIARDEVARLIGQRAQIVEVLPRSAWENEHLPGAVSLPLATLDADTARRRLSPDRPIVVYCADSQ